ncbi:unnamed protein product [Didymodactylos carnosus]|uniref:Uncharacterized protein n=1 Tax=Didymodactylos carnosus TaxID=1234261 RepID=A0A815H4A9_9BILA|nr:unnamed protein product [Didymodactylos carnosus]CAF4211904.1 unnamed protein product [Didymodactylos carnosus]
MANNNEADNIRKLELQIKLEELQVKKEEIALKKELVHLERVRLQLAAHNSSEKSYHDFADLSICYHLDPWLKISSSKGGSRSSSIKATVLHYYDVTSTTCMILGELFQTGKNHIVSAHLWPVHAAQSLSFVSIPPTMINHPRNILRIIKELEVKYGHREITIIKIDNVLKLYVLNKSITNTRISSYLPTTFKDVHLRTISFKKSSSTIHESISHTLQIGYYAS